jgi:histidinol-phosphate aminotransferase
MRLRPGVLPAAAAAPWYAREPGSELRLALSEVHRGPHPAVRAAVLAELDRLHLYPDADVEPLRTAIARGWSAPPEAVTVTNGSDEAMFCCVIALAGPDAACVTTERTFAGYRAACEVVGAPFRATPVTERGIEVAAFLEALPDARLAILCNPHNPTGACLPPATVARIAAEAARHGVVLVVDEAYGEFADPSAFTSAWHCGGDEVVVLRTFSKCYGLAGLRCGYALSGRGLAARIGAPRSALPYNVNRFALAAARAALEDQNFLRETIAINRRTRTELADALDRHGFEVAPSQTNFLMTRLGPDIGPVVEGLRREENIIIRDCASLGFPDWARIGVCEPRTVDRLVRGLARLRDRFSASPGAVGG